MLGAKVIARAKINLFLKVGPLREDGYHEIRSVMQSLELADELYFRRTDGADGRIVLRCSEGDIPSGEDNIIWRAAETFASETGTMGKGGVEVFVNKRIPVGAGLAGGSADAAATLLAMNHMWELDLPFERLSDMAALIGSDVPFCLIGGTALVEGRGERVTSLETLPALQVVLAAPEEECSTEEVYGRFDSLEPGEIPDEEELELALGRLMDGIAKHDFEAIFSNLHNSLESATIARDRVEQYKKAAYKAGAVASLMTGSGPTVFALASGMEEAAEVAWEIGQVAPITILTSFAERGVEISKWDK